MIAHADALPDHERGEAVVGGSRDRRLPARPDRIRRSCTVALDCRPARERHLRTLPGVREDLRDAVTARRDLQSAARPFVARRPKRNCCPLGHFLISATSSGCSGVAVSRFCPFAPSAPARIITRPRFRLDVARLHREDLRDAEAGEALEDGDASVVLPCGR